MRERMQFVLQLIYHGSYHAVSHETILISMPSSSVGALSCRLRLYRIVQIGIFATSFLRFCQAQPTDISVPVAQSSTKIALPAALVKSLQSGLIRPGTATFVRE